VSCRVLPPSLSVLVACLPQRAELARPLLESLWRQATPDVEVLALTDNQRRTIGDKRNAMLDMARGEYVAFVDDDDMVTDDYVSSILGALGSDVVVFDVDVTINGGTPFPMRFSKDYGQVNYDRLWERCPNHLMPVRRELAPRFPDVNVGEDAEYARRLKSMLRTETRIDRALYHYRYSDAVTATQR
jgi:glycosyltransferase involved in cell wall biosynthesis